MDAGNQKDWTTGERTLLVHGPGDSYEECKVPRDSSENTPPRGPIKKPTPAAGKSVISR